MDEMTPETFEKMRLKELQEIAVELKIEKAYKYKKDDLILRIITEKKKSEQVPYGFGVLDILADGYGFLTRFITVILEILV